MGFFDLKAICGVCGNEAGLNRFKIRKSDAWVCATCMKRAGGVLSVSPNNVTIEDIKEILNQKDSSDNVKAEKIQNGQLATAEAMYENCKKNNYGSGFTEGWGVKHFKLIEDSLMKDEEVLMTFIGLHNYISTTKHDNNFAYAITNKRILIAQKKVIGETLQTISLDNINDITLNVGIVFGVMTVDTIKEKFNIAVAKASARKIYDKVHQIFNEQKNKKNNGISQATSTLSVPDELKKYKELLDVGVINQEEFDTKKKQLLNL